MFIYLFMRHREAETQAEGEAGSTQGARRWTRSRDSGVTPWAEGGAQPLSHRAALVYPFISYCTCGVFPVFVDHEQCYCDVTVEERMFIMKQHHVCGWRIFCFLMCVHGKCIICLLNKGIRSPPLRCGDSECFPSQRGSLGAVAFPVCISLARVSFTPWCELSGFVREM